MCEIECVALSQTALKQELANKRDYFPERLTSQTQDTEESVRNSER